MVDAGQRDDGIHSHDWKLVRFATDCKRDGLYSCFCGAQMQVTDTGPVMYRGPQARAADALEEP